MPNLFVTLVIAFVLIVLAIASLAIGWLITGKTKIERGSCGRDPTQKRDENCRTPCELCATQEPSQESSDNQPSSEKKDSKQT